MDIQVAKSPAEVDLCYPVMAQLRPHLSLEQFRAAVARMRGEGYTLAYIPVGGAAACVAGFRLMELLSTGRILYIDDLATCEMHRSQGYGSAMLAWLRGRAEVEQCRFIELDSGANRTEAHRFYAREGLESVALHFSLPLGGGEKWVENS